MPTFWNSTVECLELAYTMESNISEHIYNIYRHNDTSIDSHVSWINS